MNVYSITNSQGQSYGMYDVNKKLTDAGIPADVIAQGETAIANYALDHSITLPTDDKQEPKTEQLAMNNTKAAGQLPKPENSGAQLDLVA